MIISDVQEQGSEAWFEVRKGRATASQFRKILTPTGAYSKQAIKYMRQLARECVCDDPMEWMGNKYTDWGNQTEAEARDVFAETTGLTVKQVGFVARDDGAPLGFSPDGLIVDQRYDESSPEYYIAGLEIKCPAVDTHVGYLMDGHLPDAHKLQVHGSMAVSRLPYWYYFSYFPGLRPLLLKIERDEFTEKVAHSLDRFLIDYAAERERVLAAILPEQESGEDEMPFLFDEPQPEEEFSLI